MTKLPKVTNQRASDARGLMSFLIALIMLAVITLIVIGFTQVTNRNRRQALDRQLSSQAFYAAESGVNDVVKIARAQLAAGNKIERKTDCKNQGIYEGLVSELQPSPSIRYTCVMVEPAVPDLLFSVDTHASTVFMIDPYQDSGLQNQLTLDTLKFSWTPPAGTDTPATSGCGSKEVFPANLDDTCTFGLLRVDILQYDPAATTYDSNGLLAKTSSFYFQPLSSGAGNGAYTPSTTGVGTIVDAACSNTCNVTLSVSNSMQARRYYVRMTMLYKSAETVRIDGSGSGKNAFFGNAQILVDSTGKAEDVLRRIQVRASLQSKSLSTPDAGVQTSGDVCKKFTIYNAGGTSFIDDLCQ